MQYDQAQKEIKKIMTGMAGKYSLYNIFRDFITLSAYTISNSVDRQQWQKREDMYLETIKKYSKDEANKFAEMLALVITGLSGSRMGDFLGELYMSMEFGNKHSGQFFTPYHVSELMSQLIDAEPNEQGTIELNEPACGSGGMIIAYAETMKRSGLNYQTQLKVVCNDIDYDVVKMCYIQLSLLGIDAVVMQGDTITLTMNEIWYTPMHVMNKVKEQQKENTANMVNSMRKAIKLAERRPKQLEKPVQLSLF